MKIDDAVNAVRVLKQFCKEQESCVVCPFAEKAEYNSRCGLETTPYEYRFDETMGNVYIRK